MGGIATEPLRSRGSPKKGTKSELATSPLPSRGPTSGWNCYITPTFSGVPSKGGKIKSSKVVTSPRLSWGPTSGRNCYITPAFSGVPSKGDKINSGCIGGKDKSVDMQAKRISPKFFRRSGVLASKNTLNPPPPQTIFKGGGVRNPSWYRISENPPVGNSNTTHPYNAFGERIAPNTHR